MKLCLLTYKLGASWDIDKLIEVAKAIGCAGMEFRAEVGHLHGVELGSTKTQRCEIRHRIEDANLEAVCIGTSCNLGSYSKANRESQLARGKLFLELAEDIGAKMIRVLSDFGAKASPPIPRKDCVEWVVEDLEQLAAYAESTRVDVNLEMHSSWCFLKEAMCLVNHPKVGIVYSSRTSDVVGGSVEAIYREIGPWIRLVHMREFSRGFPYPELFALLRADGYMGYLSTEILRDSISSEEYLATYATLFRTWAGLPFFVPPPDK